MRDQHQPERRPARMRAAEPAKRQPAAEGGLPPVTADASRRPASPPNPSSIEDRCINTIRTLAMDAVQQANSGHPGTPMALAPVIYTLWQSFLRFDPDDSIWPNRDRFVLSNGHASMLLYAMLHLGGVKAVNAKGERRGELAVTLE